ncbi:YveK family protein [Gephyromycinifex aptenodytis]|uniref:YveK family protein n=1 Tax=Gephyromycinifex aptenodytis TaxID=2716227 RepID=UPI001444D590|nr:hypothetical protein [Gephyromycinifex aptenodytis]
MSFDDLRRMVVRGWALMGLCTLIGAVVGFLGYSVAPAHYRSSARTSVVAASTEGRVEALYQVTQAIRVTMPQYLSLARSADVAQEASKASGLSPEEIGALETTTSPDSTVIQWSMQGQDPQQVQKALAASVDAFAKAVEVQSPRTDGNPVVGVNVDAPASLGERDSLLSPITAGLLGAAMGFLAASLIVLLKERTGARAFDAEDVEASLRTAVLGHLPQDAAQRRITWEYVGAFVDRRSAPGCALLVGVSKRPTSEDVDMLAAQFTPELEGEGGAVAAARLDDDDLARQAASARAVVLMVPRGQDDLENLRRQTHSLQAVCPGPVCAVLDDR